MIISNGIDIVDIRRIRKIIEKYNQKFKKKCFHQEEINKSESRLKSIESYAKRYAAKEACAKALGTGLARGVYWKDIEIINNKYGKPKIKLHNKALKFLNSFVTKDEFSIEVSLSDEKNYAIANVIICGNEKK
jgi:holo-[acyl-carrier protein] synthase